jgi:hypothetical protein
MRDTLIAAGVLRPGGGIQTSTSGRGLQLDEAAIGVAAVQIVDDDCALARELANSDQVNPRLRDALDSWLARREGKKCPHRR